MFLVISQRKEFLRRWISVLDSRGAVASVAGLADHLDDAPLLLAILDLCTIEENPGEFLRKWQQRCGKAKFVLGGPGFTPQREMAAIAAGVVACCGDDVSVTDMERIVSVVLQGGVWISRTTLPHFVDRLQAFSARADAPVVSGDNGAVSELTSRQLEVARLVGQGASNKEIARTLGITDRTVKAHLTAIFEKLGVTDRLHLALYVTKHPM